MGPYEIETIFDNGAMRIKTIDDHHVSSIVNGHRLHLYHKNTSKEEFTHQIQQQSNMEWINGGMLPLYHLTICIISYICIYM